MVDRVNAVTFKGQPLTLSGDEPKMGQPAPDFAAVNGDLRDVALSSLHGKVVVLSAVPSLDTPVCSAETQRFSREAGVLGGGVAIVTLSMDLPFAQKRWCQAHDVNNVLTLSDYRQGQFGSRYGVLIKELRLLARALFVVDREGRLMYQQVVPEISHEPDYDEALAVVRALLAAPKPAPVG